ncbi:MAG TPA: hypothetical protein VE631_09665, partial [Alphaproteobacteria bacterium]|nr:hypothetical protein [Alphaproteobacteria bacterium]
MRAMLIKLAAAGAVLTLTACAGSGLEHAMQTTPPSDPFAQAQHQGYLGLAKDEYQEGHYQASDVYAKRATR